MDRAKKHLGAEDAQKSSDDAAQQSPENSSDPEDVFDMGLFGNIAQMFLMPSELQKQIESQLEEIMRQMETGEVVQENRMDEEINKEDFKRLLKDREGPFISTSPSVLRTPPKKKLTDDERVLDKIHGTTPEESSSPMMSKRNAIAPFVPPGHPRIDIWTPVMPPGGGQGSSGGGRAMFQGVITTTVRRADGTTETKKITYDKDGNQTTTIQTIDKDGRKETKVLGGNPETLPVPSARTSFGGIVNTARQFFVNPAGYVLPRNLW